MGGEANPPLASRGNGPFVLPILPASMWGRPGIVNQGRASRSKQSSRAAESRCFMMRRLGVRSNSSITAR